ncbi:MAG TPA: ATP-binding protein [Planctomycetota bacterium]|nr:ATP-binding protein [Planctomycetota bacterium]
MPPAAQAAGLLAEGVAAGALLAAAVLGAAWLSMRRRLRELNSALRSVAAGDLDSALPPSGPGVIGELNEGIGAMAGTLRSNYEELKTHDELRRRLIANVSHELRTPLTNIQGYLESARLDGPQSPDYAKHLEVSLREARKLNRLVQDLFELSKLDTRKLEFHFETVSLTELADQVGLAFEQRMADKQIRFEMRFPDDPLEVRGDGNRLGQVVQNLLGNAAVFTEPGGRVTLSCERAGSKAIIAVTDTGIGIAEKDLPHIFESFFHLEKSQTRNLGGTGLGLAICKAIVDAHQGTISVSSRVGQGTTFRVELALSGAG